MMLYHYPIDDTSFWSTDFLEAYNCRYFLLETLWFLSLEYHLTVAISQRVIGGVLQSAYICGTY